MNQTQAAKDIAHPRSVPGRRTIFFSAMIIALLCIGMNSQGWLQPFENWLYDQRVERCQFFTPPATDQLIHVAIDDESLYQIGRWPWDRRKLASLVDTLRYAGAKTIAFDIIFAEPQPPIESIVSEPGEVGRMITHKPDQLFADAMKRHGGCLLPIGFSVTSGMSQVNLRVLEWLRENPFLLIDQLKQKLADEGLRANDDHVYQWHKLRRHALFEIITQQLDEGIALSDIEARLQKRRPPQIDELDILRQLQNAQTLHAVKDKTLATPSANTSGSISKPLSDTDVIPDLYALLGPVEPLASATAGVGHIGTDYDADGTSRTIHPWLSARGHAFLQFGIAMAADFLDVAPDQVELRSDAVVLKPTGREAITIPLVRPRHRDVASTQSGSVRIPWRGPRDRWLESYSTSTTSAEPMYHSLQYVYQAVILKEKMQSNAATMRDALFMLAEISDRYLHKEIKKTPATFHELKKFAPAVLDRAGFVLDSIKTIQDIPDDASPNDKQLFTNMIAARDAVHAIMKLQPELESRLLEHQQKLRTTFEGKAVLVGWTATGTVDYHITPLHSYCPGFLIDSMMFNAILTNDFWTDAPTWSTYAVTAMIALLLALIWSRMKPIATLLASALLLVALLVVNGVVLFDYHNLVMELACPLLTWALICAISIVLRLEFRNRALIAKS